MRNEIDQLAEMVAMEPSWPTFVGGDGRLQFREGVDVRDVVVAIRNESVRRAGERLAALLAPPDVSPPTWDGIAPGSAAPEAAPQQEGR